MGIRDDSDPTGEAGPARPVETAGEASPSQIAFGRAEDSSASPHARRRAPAGSVPGTLAIPPNALPTEIHAIRYTPDRFDEIQIDDLADLPALLDDDRVVWLDVTGFGDGGVLSELGTLLGIHPLAVADIVHTPQRSKFEDFGDRHLVVLQMGRAGTEQRVELEQITLVLGPTWVVTFQERPGDVFDPVRNRLRHGLGSLRGAGPDYLAYALVDAIVDGFFPVLEQLGDQLNALDERVLSATDRGDLRDIHTTRRLLIRLHRILWSQRDAISAMLRNDHSPFGRSVHVYLRDTYDHSVQLLELVETSRELAVALLEIHLSSVNNRMNEVMKTLTVMASTFIPLTFLTGIYGMNFHHMPELDWSWAYPLFWAVILVIAIVLLSWFYRRGWLQRDDDGQ